MNLSIKEIYQIQHRGGQALYLEDYTIPKKYIQGSQIKQFSPKKISVKKSFLDDHIRSVKYIPGVGTYSKTSRWEKERENNFQENRKSLEKYKKFQNSASFRKEKDTFFDQIITSGSKNKSPGPGQYDINKSYQSLNLSVVSKANSNQNTSKNSASSLQQKILSNQNKHRETYLDDISFQGANIPGVGTYSPRNPSEIQKVTHHLDFRKDRLKPKANFFDQNKKIKVPGVGQYNPLPQIFKTFDNQKQFSKSLPRKNFHENQQNINFEKLPHLGFGIPKRSNSLENHKPNNKIGSYPIKYSWKGKSDKPNEKTNVFQIISKPLPKSIYY